MEIVYCNELIYLTIVEWQNDRFITSLITCNYPISWLSAKHTVQTNSKKDAHTFNIEQTCFFLYIFVIEIYSK
jgi:hypothetical protein